MKQIKIQPVILAAGKGTRIITDAVAAGMAELPKVLYPLKGRPLIDWVLDAVDQTRPLLAESGIELKRPVVVVGFMKEKVEAAVSGRATCVEQLPSPLGTGHAVQVSEPAIEADADAVLVLNGDMPEWHPDTIAGVCRQFADSAKQCVLALGTVEFTDQVYNADFFAYGRILRDEAGRLVKIVEQRDASEEERQIKECNPSLYCFDREWLFSALSRLSNQNSQGEYYLTDLLAMALHEGKEVASSSSRDWREALGVNTLEQLQLAEQLIADASHT